MGPGKQWEKVVCFDVAHELILNLGNWTCREEKNVTYTYTILVYIQSSASVTKHSQHLSKLVNNRR